MVTMGFCARIGGLLLLVAAAGCNPALPGKGGSTLGSENRFPLPVPIATEEERARVVGYFDRDQKTLHVFDVERFARGVASLAFAVEWQPGTEQAIIIDPAGGTIPARVMLGIGGVRLDLSAKVGDTRYVELSKKVDHAEVINACEAYSGTAPKNTLAKRTINRGYTNLEGAGDQSGTETYQPLYRFNFYGVADCGRAFLGSDDVSFGWALSVLAWPNP